MTDRPEKPKPWTIVEVLKPHSRALTLGLLAVIGESIAEPVGALALEDCSGQRYKVPADPGLAESADRIVRFKARTDWRS